MASLGSPPSAPVAYKKKDGVLAMAPDHGSVTWTPRAAGAEGAFTVFVKDVTSMFVLLFSAPFYSSWLRV